MSRLLHRFDTRLIRVRQRSVVVPLVASQLRASIERVIVAMSVVQLPGLWNATV